MMERQALKEVEGMRVKDEQIKYEMEVVMGAQQLNGLDGDAQSKDALM